ncbi:MAG TPA: BON domain-containing protein [Parachlamydiaceae bacterium]|nr:BON domain-containing protein [Parachlamydiaceae bacterium]
MKKILLMTVCSLSLLSCDKQEKPRDPGTTPPISESNYDNRNVDNDNTGKNVRDRDTMVRTPLDQSETEADRTITQRIRQAIMSDDSLSTNAKNIKIITINGVVTLRGPVATPEEKANIVRKINNIQGILNVDNQIEVTRRN